MAMIQVDDVSNARDRARGLGIREVFDIEFEDIAEAHLHPGDIGGAIVSVSQPLPAGSWRWGGPEWNGRSVPGTITGLTVGVEDADSAEARWREVAGGPLPVDFVADDSGSGITGIELELDGRRLTIVFGYAVFDQAADSAVVADGQAFELPVVTQNVF